MPGIVGLVTRMPRERAERELLAMVDTLRHEPSYKVGTCIDEAAGIYVGWACRKGSFSDGMPLRNQRGDVCLVFSGEEFPESGTTTGLNHKRADQVGPLYLVDMYEAHSNFPARLNGRFHGFVNDRARGIGTLFNDRYGMHRVYYHESKDAFYFGAEAKAILKVRPELRRIDNRGLGELVSCGCVLENRTLFEGIKVLPAASAWTFQNGTVTRSSYFVPEEWEQQSELQPEEFYATLRESFTSNLPRYFSGPERIGMSLTGGLDTRMIMAWLKPAAGSLPCYSFGGMFRDCQDVVLARRIAHAAHQTHEVIRVGEEFLSRFGYYAQRAVYLTDGCIDVSHSADLFVNEVAAKIAPVRMTGNYGGEVLRQVRAFKPTPPAKGLFAHEFESHIEAASTTYSKLIDGHPLSFAVFRQAPWHHYGLLALEQTQVSLRSPFLDNDFVRTVFRAPKASTRNSEVSCRLINDGDPRLAKIRTDRGPLPSQTGFTDAAIRKLITFTVKAEYAYDYGMPQWVARTDHMLSPLHLERIFLGRHKFYHYRVWYRDVLSRYVRDVLLDPRTLSRQYIQAPELERMVRGHLHGDRNYTSEIHKLLTMELIHRTFVDA